MAYADSEQRAAYGKAYRQEHKEQIAERKRRYYEEHKEDARRYYEEHKEDARRYRQEHKEQIAAYYKKYREAHKEELMAYNKAWYEAHREERIAYSRAWRAALKEKTRDEDIGEGVMYSCGDCFYFGEEHEGAFYCAFDTEHTHPLNIDAERECFMKQSGLKRWRSMFDKPDRRWVFDKLR